MRTVVCCEGTTDLFMVQFILEYKYGWKYHGYSENKAENRLVTHILKRDCDESIIVNCGGVNNIPKAVNKYYDRQLNVTKRSEMVDRIIVMFDYDTVNSVNDFLEQLNQETGIVFYENQINVKSEWLISNAVLGDVSMEMYICSIPEENVGAIEDVMLEALETDEVEKLLVMDSEKFVHTEAEKQDRYLQKHSRLKKAIFNVYFSIRAPEEIYKERAKILSAYNWQENEVLNKSFSFLGY